MPGTPNLVRWLKNGTSGTATDMIYPVLGGEILLAYEEHNQMAGKVNTKSITSGNSARFPAYWKVGSEYHEAGEELLGLDVSSKEYVINLEDRPLVSHLEFDDLDSILSQFDARGPLTATMGIELAKQDDIKMLIGLLKTSRRTQTAGTYYTYTDAARTDLKAGVAASVYTGEFPLGAMYETGNFATLGSATAANELLAAIQAAAVHFDKLNVPENDRHVVVPVDLWYACRNLGSLIIGVSMAASQTGGAPVMPAYGSTNGAPGPMITNGTPKTEFLQYMGFKIWRSTHIPNVAITTGPTKWQGDFSKTVGVIFQKDAYAHVHKLGITTENFRDVRRQSDFFLAKTFVGGGELRPCCAIELLTT